MNEFKIEGLVPVLKKLKALRGPQMQKAVRAAGTRGMRIVRDAARATARGFDDPETPSNIAKAITTRNDAKGGKRIGGVVIKVGVVGGARPAKGNADTGHWRMKEFGTSKMPAEPFMRPALEGNQQRVAAVFVSELDKSIDKIVAKG